MALSLSNINQIKNKLLRQVRDYVTDCHLFQRSTRKRFLVLFHIRPSECLGIVEERLFHVLPRHLVFVQVNRIEVFAVCRADDVLNFLKIRLHP